MQLRLAQEKQMADVQMQREEEARRANAPFREKFPNLSTALSNTGLALAALLPYGTRMYQASKATPFVRAWEGTAKEAEAAMKTKEMDHARILVDQLVGFKKEALKLEKQGGPSNAVINTLSATTPLETQMLPELMDLSFGSKESKDRAKDILLDPMRLPASIGQGIVGAGLGAKAPLLNETPSMSTVRAQTEGLLKSSKDMKAAASRARSKSAESNLSEKLSQGGPEDTFRNEVTKYNDFVSKHGSPNLGEAQVASNIKLRIGQLERDFKGIPEEQLKQGAKTELRDLRAALRWYNKNNL
jgi:hypothetical protein